jgi:hypothetical protein
MIHFNIIPPSTPKSPKWSLPFKFLDVFMHFLPMRATCPTHLILDGEHIQVNAGAFLEICELYANIT